MRPQLPTNDESDTTDLLLPDEFVALVAHVEDSIRRVQSATCVAIWINIAVTGIGLLWAWSGADVFGWTVSSFMLFLFLTTHLKARKTHSFQNDAERLVKFVEHTQETTALRTILDLCIADGSLGGIWDQVSRAADSAVIRLLPLIEPIHAGMFNAQHRAHLRHGLFHHSFGDMGSWRGNEYCLVVLSALEQIGDMRDLRDVERIMQEPYISEEVRSAAHRCARTITERKVREDHKYLLLRPGLKPEAVDILLRPVVERADTPPQQLLRASSADDADAPA